MQLIDYFCTVERHHTFQNPTSETKLDRLIEYCGIRDGTRVLDVGCGKAWLLRRMAANYQIEGVGIELRAGFVAEAREHIRRTVLKGSTTIHHMSAADYPAETNCFDIGLCLGASFAIGSFEEMVAWLKPQVSPGGCLAVGDVYAKKSPLPEETAKHFWNGAVRNLSQTVEILRDNGLGLIALIDSSLDDWDRYASLHWLTADKWLRANEDHPDSAEFRRISERWERQYLECDRETLGWGIFVCRT
jgi:cyclopropane fatty-acyl-phospholipid synthase-like methyltransferase